MLHITNKKQKKQDRSEIPLHNNQIDKNLLNCYIKLSYFKEQKSREASRMFIHCCGIGDWCHHLGECVKQHHERRKEERKETGMEGGKKAVREERQERRKKGRKKRKQNHLNVYSRGIDKQMVFSYHRGGNTYG